MKQSIAIQNKQEILPCSIKPKRTSTALQYILSLVQHAQITTVYSAISFGCSQPDPDNFCHEYGWMTRIRGSNYVCKLLNYMGVGGQFSAIAFIFEILFALFEIITFHMWHRLLLIPLFCFVLGFFWKFQ